MTRSASVTVTFSLVFLIMLGFVLSFFEMASYTARQAYHAAASALAVENFFASYLTPLYEEYRILGREAPSEGSLTEWADSCIVPDVAFMTEKQDGELSLLLRGGAEYQTDVAAVLSAGKAEGFLRQATESVAVRSPILAKDFLKELLTGQNQVKTHMKVAGEQQKTAEAYALIEEGILTLIELIDGVKLNQYEQFLRGKSTMFLTDDYVKLFCTEIETASVYFERAEVYREFLSNVIDPVDFLDGLIKGIRELSAQMEEREQKEETENRLNMERERSYLNLSERVKEIDEQTDKETTELSECQRKLRAAYKKGKLVIKKEELTKLELQEKRLYNSLSALSEEEEELLTKQPILIYELEEGRKELERLDRLRIEQEKQAAHYQSEEKRLSDKCERMAEKCRQAITQTEKIQRDLVTAAAVREGCETLLSYSSLILGEEAANDYRQELKKYDQYENAEKMDIPLLKTTLTNDLKLLESGKTAINGTDAAALFASLRPLEQRRDALKAYSFEGMRLPYGDMSLDESPEKKVKSILKDAAGNSFLKLVTSETLSGKELDTSFLPSLFQGTEEPGENPLSALLKSSSGFFDTLLRMMPEQLSETETSILFQMYLTEHFRCFTEPSEHALCYELEYVIGGEKTDTGNLSSFLTKIFAMRVALHFASLFSDRERKAPAEAAAAAACGAIGLPVLKSVVVFFLLLVWAAEEAVVDVATLLLGKGLSPYPGKKGGSLTFPELFRFNKKLVQEKAKMRKETVGVKLSYLDFIQLFLLLLPMEKKVFRALDLIQENLRLRYRASFRINRCIYELQYRVDNRKYSYSYLN